MGKCHADCFAQARNIGVKLPSAADAQGFVTSSGKFVMRKAAAMIAVEAGQIHERTTVLISEDLWSPTAGGKFQYDYIRGYF